MEKLQSQQNLTHIGRKLLRWYAGHGRDLPFRKTKDPYKIWICEIIFQQTRIQQGIEHYNRFVERFPDAATLAEADEDEVLLYWKGLGYYSRAINIHKAAQQIKNEYGGTFPSGYEDILQLKGVGKYTAAAISSICFQGDFPAVDGNFYRVLSRVFADDYDISKPSAFAYFSLLAKRIMPEGEAGNFNQAMMDLGSEICRPKNPLCSECPVSEDCLAFQAGRVSEYPVKSKKVKNEDLLLHYYFVAFGQKFLIRRRGEDFIWKKLYEFPDSVPQEYAERISSTKAVRHKLTHKNLTVMISRVEMNSEQELTDFALKQDFSMISFRDSHQKSFPKPLEKYIQEAENKA